MLFHFKIRFKLIIRDMNILKVVKVKKISREIFHFFFLYKIKIYSLMAKTKIYKIEKENFHHL